MVEIEFFSPKVLAARWSRSRQYIYDLVAAGQLKAIPWGRMVQIHRSEVERLERGLAMRDGYHIGQYRAGSAPSSTSAGSGRAALRLARMKGEAERQIRELNAKRERAAIVPSLTVDAMMHLYIEDRERERQSSGLAHAPVPGACCKPISARCCPNQIEQEALPDYIERSAQHQRRRRHDPHGAEPTYRPPCNSRSI